MVSLHSITHVNKSRRMAFRFPLGTLATASQDDHTAPVFCAPTCSSKADPSTKLVTRLITVATMERDDRFKKQRIDCPQPTFGSKITNVAVPTSSHPFNKSPYIIMYSHISSPIDHAAQEEIHK
mmetsp:Transcript_16768/g.30475  ORF Transcript_16768/g.30475 Transcript_16768/m.30475 type:complete len:124 (-) Transcript_16768:504-875(-)